MKPPIYLLGLLVLFWPLAAAPQASSDIMGLPLERMSHVTVQYYDIDGYSERQLGDSMDKLGPSETGDTKDHGAGRTDYKISGNWRLTGGPSCKVAEVTVTYTITVTLPRPKNLAQFNTTLRMHWDTFLAALTLHEKGHIALTVFQVEQIERLATTATCDNIQSLFKQQLDVLAKAQIDYDTATDHGKKQGTIL